MFQKPAELSLSYEIDCKAGANTTISMEAVSGCIYNSYDGSQTVEYKQVSTGETNIYGEISASMGPRLSINAEFLDDAVKASLGAEGGVALNGKAVAFTAPLPGTDSYHACDLCIDGTLQGYFEVEMAADYNIHEKLQGSIIDFDLLKAKWNMGRFYCSLLNEADSVHKGNVVFDFGNCPNSKYRTILHTYKNQEELTGCSVYIKNANGTLVDNGSSIYQTYAYPGKYSAEAVIDGRNGVKSFTVSDKPVSVDIVVKDYYLNGFVTDESTKMPLSGVTVLVKKAGNAVTTVVTDVNGYYEVLLLEDGTYDIYFSKSGYNDASSNVTFSDNQTASLNTSLKPASFKVTFTITCWGQTVPGAVIEGAGSQALVTGSDGTVTVELPPGRYFLIARGKGYYGNATINVAKDMNVTIDMFLLDHL